MRTRDWRPIVTLVLRPLVFKRALASVATAADSQVMLNSFDILRTKISFLVVKVMGALPDAEAGWVQAFPCCFGA